MKNCSKCKLEKDNCEFSPDKKVKSGLSSICKPCRRLWLNNKRDELRGFKARKMEMQKQYSADNPYLICIECKALLHEENFHKETASRTGKSSLCKPCKKERYRHSYIRRADDIKKKSKEHYYKNKHLYKVRAKRSALKKFFGLTPKAEFLNHVV